MGQPKIDDEVGENRRGTGEELPAPPRGITAGSESPDMDSFHRRGCGDSVGEEVVEAEAESFPSETGHSEFRTFKMRI